MTALLSLPAFLGLWIRQWLRATGALSLMLGRVFWLLPVMNKRELLRGLVAFGWQTLPLALIVSTVIGATVVLQTSLYTERFGARSYLGWAAGYAVIWEFGPLLMGLMMAARVGARNAAELAQLSVDGQLLGLAGISLDPVALLVAPRVWAVVLSVSLLAMPAFLLAILWEIVAAYFTLDLPVRVFLGTFESMLGWTELSGGLIKAVAFAWAIALVSTLVGVSAQGGSRAVGRAAASSVVWSAAAIFSLDFAISSLLAQLASSGLAGVLGAV